MQCELTMPADRENRAICDRCTGVGHSLRVHRVSQWCRALSETGELFISLSPWACRDWTVCTVAPRYIHDRVLLACSGDVVAKGCDTFLLRLYYECRSKHQSGKSWNDCQAQHTWIIVHVRTTTTATTACCALEAREGCYWTISPWF